MADYIDYDRENFIWTAPSAENVFNKNCSVGQIALSMLRSQPADAICQISDWEHTTLTFGQVVEYAIKIAQHLKQLGLNENDVVGIVAPNTTFVLPLVVGCWLNCTPFQAVNPSYELDAITQIYNTTRPKLIFCDGDFYEKIKTATKALDLTFYTICNHIAHVQQVEDIFKSIKKVPPMFQAIPLKYGADQTMAIYCTSGTTGKPKCAPYSNARLGLDGKIIDNETVLFGTSGLDWGSGLRFVTFNVLNGAKRIVTTKPFSCDYIIEIIKKYGVTVLGLTPNQAAELSYLREFSKSNLPSLRFIITGGAPCMTDTLKRLKKQLNGVTLLQIYGCTECGLVSTNITAYEMGVLGKLCPGVSLKILDTATNTPLGYNKKGEICVNNGLKWLGYIGNPKATREIMDVHGWMHTGDIGFMDNENVLHFVDRCKEILKYDGLHFSPSEIECTINELHDVQDVCVFGVYDENIGDLAAAAIVKVANSTLSESDVIEYVAKKKQVIYKCLNYGVFFVDKIQRNSNGKLLRNKMRDFCLNMSK